MALRDLEKILGIKYEGKGKPQQNNDGGWKSYTILRQKTKNGYIFYGTGRFKGLKIESELPIPPVMGNVFKGTDVFKAIRIKDIDCYNEGLHVRRED